MMFIGFASGFRFTLPAVAGGVKHPSCRPLIAGALCFVFLLAAAIPALHAQEVTGEIAGTVVDPSGASINNAGVTAKDVRRGTSWTTKTNESGTFRIEKLPAGRYEVKVEAQGFQSALQPAFDLILNQVARLSFAMKVGAASEILEVKGVNPILETDTTETTTNIDSVVTENVPLITRNYGQLTLLTPGAISTNPGAFVSGQSTFQVGRPYINGNREQTNNYILDGIDNNQNDNNDVAYSPNVDAIQEFNVITQNPSAEFGNYLGGIVNATIKSGTNSYHGSGFEFLRNDVFNANEWSNNLQGDNASGDECAPRPRLRYNQFGATFGGPIINNKLFFFVDYQGQLMTQPTTQSAQVLDSAERSGNFGELCTSAGGAFNASGQCIGSSKSIQLYMPGPGISPNSRVIVPFNNLTAAGLTLSPTALAIVSSPLYPLPNASGNNFNYQQLAKTNQNQGDVKLDYALSEKDRFFARYTKMDVESPTTETYLLAANGFTSNSFPLQALAVDWTHTLSATLLNDLRFGVNYFPIRESFSNPAGENLPQTFGIPGSPSTFMPSISGSFGNVAPIGNNLSQSAVFADTVIEVSDSVTKVAGKHELRGGFQFFRYRDNFLYPGNEGLAGEFGFTGQYTANPGQNPTLANPAVPQTGSGLADFMLGFPSSLGLGQGVGDRHVNSSIIAAFAQDNWRLSHSLTLNVGLRWDLNMARVAEDGNAVNYDLQTGELILPNANNEGLGSALYKTYNGWANVQPRIGLAWQPWFVRNTVVHVAYGISTYMESNGVNNLLTQNPPFETAHDVTFSATTTDLPGSTLSQGFTGFPTGCTLALAEAFSPTCFNGAIIHGFDPHLRPAVHYMRSFSIERQFGKASTLQVGYVGESTQHMANIIALEQTHLTPNGNDPFTAAGTITPSPFLNPTLLATLGNGQARLTVSNAIANYNAAQATFVHRFDHGLQAQVNYTWSKCLSDAPGFFGQFGDAVATQAQTISAWAFPQNLYDQMGDYGRCPQDVASLVNGYAVYELPFGHGRMFGNGIPRALDAVAGGWRLSTGFTFHTGFAQTIFASSDFSGTGSFSERADCVAGAAQTVPFQPSASNPLLYQFLNPAAVTNPVKGTFGDCAVGAFRGPGYKTIDLSLGKTFAITERQTMEFRIDASNFTNTPNFNFGEEFSGQHTAGASNFGTIDSSQGARQLQFGLKYRF